MAELTVDTSEVVVHLSALEALAVWRREVSVPIECLKMVHVEQSPLGSVAAPGLRGPRGQGRSL